MTAPPAQDRSSVELLKAAESCVLVCAGVAVMTLVVGFWLGINAATATSFDGSGEEQHATLGIGVAIVVLTVAVCATAAMLAVVLHTYARPRRAAYNDRLRLEAERLAAEGL